MKEKMSRGQARQGEETRQRKKERKRKTGGHETGTKPEKHADTEREAIHHWK